MKTKSPKMDNEKEILAEITSGKYKNQYLLYHRQSTDEADSQKNSLEYQEAENTKFITRENLVIANCTLPGFCRKGIIGEKHSGFIEDDEVVFTKDGKAQLSIDRPKFQKLLFFLNCGYFKGIVCLSWDRLSRNRADDTIVRKLMRNGVDFRFAYAKYDQSSAGELHMDIDGMFAAHHSRVTREKVLATIRTSRDKGLCTNLAPIGYLNLGSMEQKPLDPVRAPIIKRMFELYATGNWSLSDLAGWANAQGLTTPARRRRRKAQEMLMEDSDIAQIPKVSRPISINAVSRMLSSWFYTGRTVDNQGNYVKSNSHEALVSDELFNTVQQVLKGKQISIHYTEKIKLPFRGLLRCAICERVFTPYIKKGIEYFASRCRNGCDNSLRSFNFEYISKLIGDYISSISFTDSEIEQINARVNTDLVLLEENRFRELEEIARKKKKIREDLTYINLNRLVLLKTGVYSPEAFVEEVNRLNHELTTLQQNEIASDKGMRETLQTVSKLSELMKNVTRIYSKVEPFEKDEIVRLLISELKISANTLIISHKKDFRCFEDRELAICAPIVWLSELVPYKDNIEKLIADLYFLPYISKPAT